MEDFCIKFDLRHLSLFKTRFVVNVHKELERKIMETMTGGSGFSESNAQLDSPRSRNQFGP